MALASDAEAPLLDSATSTGQQRSKAAAVLAAAASAFAALGTVLFLATAPALGPAALPTASTLAAENGPAKVHVELYGMAGCPFTRGFIEGSLTETLATASDIVDFQLHPFGNSYYATEHCGGTAEGMPFASYNKGYNQTIRECWDKMCGAPAAEPSGDCFSGTLICQHGATDGMVTTAWACAKAIAQNEHLKFMPFVRCTADRFLGITTQASFRSVVGGCAASTGFEAEELVSCAQGERGRQLLNAEARRTVAHPAVPYALVDGKELADTSCVACGDGIMQKVCEAWRAKGGKDTPACQGIFGLV